MSDSGSLLHQCLYFAANSLARVITRIAEEEFRRSGLSPSHAFLVMLVHDHPGIGQKELSDQLHLAPSTVTRFIDTLVHRGILIREQKGKLSFIFATEEGLALHQPIMDAWKRLHERYANVLGLREGDALTAMIDVAAEKLKKSNQS